MVVGCIPHKRLNHVSIICEDLLVVELETNMDKDQTPNMGPHRASGDKTMDPSCKHNTFKEEHEKKEVHRNQSSCSLLLLLFTPDEDNMYETNKVRPLSDTVLSISLLQVLTFA